MKKLCILALTMLLLLSFCGCGSQSSGKYDHIVQLLEQGDYDGAKAAIDQLQGPVVEEPVAMATEAPMMEPVEEQPPVEIPPETEAPAVPAGQTVKLLTKIPVTQVDNLGNESSDNRCYYNYDDQGRVIKIGGRELAVSYGIYLFTIADHLAIVYDAEGNVENVKVVDSWDNVSALGTPTYDENGNLISMHIQSNTNEHTLNFSYDSNGNCLRADVYDTFGDELAFDIQYSYDAQGRLVQEVWNKIGFFVTGKTVDYTYDEAGILVQSYTTWHENQVWHETTVYSYDKDGDLIQSVTTSDSKDSGYKTKTADFKYEYLTVNP